MNCVNVDETLSNYEHRLMAFKTHVMKHAEDSALQQQMPIKVVNASTLCEDYHTFFTALKGRDINELGTYNESEFNFTMLLNAIVNINTHINTIRPVSSTSNSQLMQVNNVIQRSPELISYIYILKWLHCVFAKSSNDSHSSPMSTIMNVSLWNDSANSDASLNYDDVLLAQSAAAPSNAVDALLQGVAALLLQGELAKAQELCNHKKAFFVSALLEGGLPFWEEHEDVKNMLLPPYMWNMQFNSGDESDKAGKGNANWIVWLHTVYALAGNTNMKNGLRDICRFISGNTNDMTLTGSNVYKYLYVHVMSLFNSRLIKELRRNGYNASALSCYVSDCEKEMDELQQVNNNNNDITAVLNAIRSDSIYTEIKRRYPLIDIELQLLQLHFTQVSVDDNSDDLLLQRVQTLLHSVCSQIAPERRSTALPVMISEHDFVVFAQQVKRCEYLRNVCTLLVFLFKVYPVVFVGKSNLNDHLRKDVFTQYNELLWEYIQAAFEMFPSKPQLYVYVLTFMLELETVKKIVNILSNRLSLMGTQSDYLSCFVTEVQMYFHAEHGLDEVIASVVNGSVLFAYAKGGSVTVDDTIYDNIMRRVSGASHNESSSVLYERIKVDQALTLFGSDSALSRIAQDKYAIKLCFVMLYNHQYALAEQFVEKMNFHHMEDVVVEEESDFLIDECEIIRRLKCVLLLIVRTAKTYEEVLYVRKVDVNGYKRSELCSMSETLVNVYAKRLNVLLKKCLFDKDGVVKFVNDCYATASVQVEGEIQYEPIKVVFEEWLYQTCQCVTVVCDYGYYKDKTNIPEVFKAMLLGVFNEGKEEEMMLNRYIINGSKRKGVLFMLYHRLVNDCDFMEDIANASLPLLDKDIDADISTL